MNSSITDKTSEYYAVEELLEQEKKDAIAAMDCDCPPFDIITLDDCWINRAFLTSRYCPYWSTKEKALLNDGFVPSEQDCPTCGGGIFVKVKKKPSSWESDVSVISFRYSCPSCNAKWVEYDSD